VANKKSEGPESRVVSGEISLAITHHSLPVTQPNRSLDGEL